MNYYPICLDIQNRPCLVVGGGHVGTRKVKGLLRCGAQITVISPKVTDELAELVHQAKIQWLQRDYCAADLHNTFLVIGATDDEALNHRIHQDAEKARRLCNIVDQPDRCNFILPAVVQQGDLLIAISTSGNSPAFAKHLRQQMQNDFGAEYNRFLKLMGAIRTRLLEAEQRPETHKPLFEKLINSELLELIKTDDQEGINRVLDNVLGPGYEYETLMADFAGSGCKA